MRYAEIYSNRKEVEAYLPRNYSVIAEGEEHGRAYVIIEGEDVAGWTLDGYVLPRLGSGLIAGKEINL